MSLDAIHQKEGLIVTRDELSNIVESNCLEACLTLYDKNIRTVAANGSIHYAANQGIKDGIRDALFIHIDYDSLDDTNKQIAMELYNNHLVDISDIDTYGGVRKKVIISEKNSAKPGQRPIYDIDSFIKKCKNIADSFKDQDVLFGRYSPSDTLKQILLINNSSDHKAFLMENELADFNMNPNIQKIIEYVNRINCPIFINDEHSGDYKTIYLGKIYDDESNEFWANQELLDKHKNYLINCDNISNNL